MDQELSSSLTEWFYLRVSDKAAVKMVAGVEAIWKFGDGGSASRWLPHMAGKSVLTIGKRPQLLVRGVLSIGYVSILIYQLSCPRARDPREQGRGHSIFYDPTSEITLHHFLNIRLVTQLNPFYCRWGIHKGVNTRKWGLWGAILETGYHICEIMIIFLMWSWYCGFVGECSCS